MDPENSAQDVTRCELCKDNVVQSYCDFCHFNLCKPCIGEHIFDEYDNHRIVPLHYRNLTLVYSKCKIHRNEICDFLCKNCKISVCSFCMVSNQHKGHDFFELSEVYKTNVKMAKNEKDELEKNHHTLENDIFDLENQIAHVDATYEKLKKEMLEQKNKWHREINYVINKMKKRNQCNKIDAFQNFTNTFR